MRRKQDQGAKYLVRLGLVFGLVLLGVVSLGGVLHYLTQGRFIPTISQRESPHKGNWVYTSVTYQDDNHEVNVYLPVDYPNDAPYPVVFLLNGWGGRPGVWNAEFPTVAKLADRYSWLIVAVEGDDRDIPPAWYSKQTSLPWPDGPDWTISFYDWFFLGVLPWVEAAHPTRTDPGGRTIAGFSMGGKGALSLAGHRPDLFTAAATWAGVMDLRDFDREFEIPVVYGPLTSYQMRYAADSPLELAPNLKGVNMILLHGANGRFVPSEQSQRMDQALNNLGYIHIWEEIPGLGHEVSPYEIARTFELFATVFDAPYTPPVAWRYRFADDFTRQVYQTILTKTNPLTWTEIVSVTAGGFDIMSGDSISMTTASLYTPEETLAVTITYLSDDSSSVNLITTDKLGRLSLNFPAGYSRVTITPASPVHNE